MVAGNVDIAIHGATPLAGLLAGLLASRHKRTVALVGAPAARYRLPHGIDVSVAPLTRPETWSLVRDNRADILKLLTRIGGKAAVRRFDCVFLAESAAGKDALGHIGVMASGYGEAVELLPEDWLLPGAAAFRLRDAAMIERPLLEPGLAAWLEKLGVRREFATAGLTVLADDEAVLAHATELASPLIEVPMTVLLTEPALPLVAPLLFSVDRGLAIAQSTEGSLTALASGAPAKVLAQVGAVLSRDHTVRRAGQAGFTALAALDGAPVVGPLGPDGPFVVCGLGPVGAFMAPALARCIADTASPEEEAYFTARSPTASRTAIADYCVGAAR
jgi:hypothetical protein